MIFLTFVNVALYAVFVRKVQCDNDLNEPVCSQSVGPVITQSAYMNWPFTISCGMLNDQFYDNFYDSIELENVECQIWDSDNNVLLVNQSVTADDYHHSNYATYDHIATEITSNHYEVVMLHNFDGVVSCASQYVRLNITKLPEQTCEEALNSLENRDGDLGLRKKWTCASSDDTPQVPLSDNLKRDNITVQWLKNCKPLPEGTGSMDGTSLHLNQIKYDHAGNYTCAVHRNGQTIYLAATNFCVRGPTIRAPEPTLKCDSVVVRAKEDAPATINCVGTLGVGNIRRHHYYVIWNKEGESSNSCINQLKQERIMRKEGSPQCTTNYQDQPCFAVPPPLEDRKAIPAEVFIKLTIPKVHESSIGKYVISFAAVEYQTPSYVNATVEIKIASEASEVRNFIIAGICLGVAALLVVALIVGLLCRRKGNMCRRMDGKRKLQQCKSDTITDEFEMTPNSEEETKPV